LFDFFGFVDEHGVHGSDRDAVDDEHFGNVM